MKNLLFVCLFLIVSACNSCQKSTALIEDVKVENAINIQGKEYDCSNVIIVEENYPVEKCGILNEAGKVFVRDIVAFSKVAKDSTFIDQKGILQVAGEAVVYKLNQ